jgi:hypothetical protein
MSNDEKQKKATSALIIYIASQIIVVVTGLAIDQIWLAAIPPIAYLAYISTNGL